MQFLIVAATPPEVQPLIQHFDLQAVNTNNWQGKTDKHIIRLLVTGIGMTNTAYHLGKYLAQHRPDFAINMGIAGTFDTNITLGTVVEIIEDTFSEMGAENHDDFLTLFDLGFPLSQIPTTYYNTFTNPNPTDSSYLKTSAITVNTVHGNAASIARCQQFWNKQIETMESAAFFQIMVEEAIPFAAFRGISNYVEPRNRANWQIGAAVKNVNLAVIEQILK